MESLDLEKSLVYITGFLVNYRRTDYRPIIGIGHLTIGIGGSLLFVLVSKTTKKMLQISVRS